MRLDHAITPLIVNVDRLRISIKCGIDISIQNFLPMNSAMAGPRAFVADRDSFAPARRENAVRMAT